MKNSRRAAGMANQLHQRRGGADGEIEAAWTIFTS